MRKVTARHKVIATCLNGLSSAGYDVEETVDFASAVRALLSLGKPYLTPNMSPFENDFTHDNCFWLLLSYNGQLIGGIAARNDNLGDESLGNYWRRSARRLYGSGTEEKISTVSKFIDRNVRGSITYFGDLILEKNHRNNGTHLRYFTMYAQMVAAEVWNADWTYSFIGEDRAESGGAFTYGFSKTIPGAQTWINPPKIRSSSECCVISSADDIDDIATYYAQNPRALSVERTGKSKLAENSDQLAVA